MVDEPYLICPVCARPQLFEQPPCPDGHGADCPERVCVSCATAVFVAPGARTSRRRRGGAQRYAA